MCRMRRSIRPNGKTGRRSTGGLPGAQRPAADAHDLERIAVHASDQNVVGALLERKGVSYEETDVPFDPEKRKYGYLSEP